MSSEGSNPSLPAAKARHRGPDGFWCKITVTRL